MPHAAELIARTYARGLLPRKIANPLFWRAAARGVDDAEVTTTVHFDGIPLKLVLPLRQKQNWTLLFETFDRAEDAHALRLFSRLASKSSAVVDVGVNVGLYLYHAAVHDCRVLGIEPNQDLVETVNRNLEANGRGNATVIQAAATSEPGPVEVFFTDSDLTTSLERSHAERWGGVQQTTTVRGDRLDSLTEDYEVDLIKVDVEGHELALLAGAERLLGEKRATWFIEVTPATAAGVNDVFARHGYRGERLTVTGTE